MAQILLPGQPVAAVCGRAGAVCSCLSRPCVIPPLGCAGAGVTSAGTGRHKHPCYRSGCIFAGEDKRVAGLGWAQSKPQLCWNIQIARWGHSNYQQLTKLIPHSLPSCRSLSSCCLPCCRVWDSSSTCPAPPALITPSPAPPSVKNPAVKAL